VRVSECVAFFVAHGFEELVDPDRSVDGEALAVECRERGGTRGGREDGPEACYSHLEISIFSSWASGEVLSSWIPGVVWGGGGSEVELKALKTGPWCGCEEARTSCITLSLDIRLLHVSAGWLKPFFSKLETRRLP
jgi:hypothetical protein